MSTWRRHPWLLLAAMMFAAVPVAFGAIRAITTGDDVRYLWMAGAAMIGSLAVVPWTSVVAPPAAVRLVRGMLAIACGTACAAVTAVVQGARSVPSVAIVALSFGLCTGASAACMMLARESRQRSAD